MGAADVVAFTGAVDPAGGFAILPGGGGEGRDFGGGSNVVDVEAAGGELDAGTAGASGWAPASVGGVGAGSETVAETAEFVLAEITFIKPAPIATASTRPPPSHITGIPRPAGFTTPALGCVGNANGGAAGIPGTPAGMGAAPCEPEGTAPPPTGGAARLTVPPAPEGPETPAPALAAVELAICGGPDIGTVAGPGAAPGTLTDIPETGSCELRASGETGVIIASVIAAGPPISLPMASRISRAFANRAAGSFAVARSITACTAAGTQGARCETGCGRLSTIAIRRSRSVSASANGSLPLTS